MSLYRNTVEDSMVEAVECWRVLQWASYDWDAAPAWLKELVATKAVIVMPDSIALPVGDSMVTANRLDWIAFYPVMQYVDVFTPEAFVAFEKVPA